MCRYIKHSREEWASEHYLLFAEKTYENLDVKFSSSAGPGLGCPQSFGHPSRLSSHRPPQVLCFPGFPCSHWVQPMGSLMRVQRMGRRERGVMPSISGCCCLPHAPRPVSPKPGAAASCIQVGHSFPWRPLCSPAPVQPAP